MGNFTPISVERGGDTLTSALIEDDKIIFKQECNLNETMDSIKKESNDFDKFSPANKNFRKVASVPLFIVDDLIRKGIWNDRERLNEWLNDPDNRAFRVSLERL